VTGEHKSATFQTDDDYALKALCPKVSDQSSHPLTIVKTPPGMTMTFRKDQASKPHISH
jgi:hypothetical protein